MAMHGTARLRVLHVTNAWPSAQAPIKGVFVQEQVESLRAAGVNCEVINIEASRGSLRGYLQGLGELRRRQQDFDAVHCHHIFCILLGLLTVPRSRLVGSFMNDGRHNVKGRFAPVGGLLFGLATQWLRWQIHKARLPAGAHPEHMVCIPNGVDLARFQLGDRRKARAALGLDPDTEYALFVSANTLRREKRADLFEAAVAEVRRQGFALEPLVMTDVSRNRVPTYFVAARLHVLVSDFEGSPNSVREALASGTPVVGRDVGGVAHLIGGVEGCELVSGDVNDIAEAIVRVLHRDDGQEERAALRQSLSDRGFTMEEVARQVLAFYGRIRENA